MDHQKLQKIGTVIVNCIVCRARTESFTVVATVTMGIRLKITKLLEYHVLCWILWKYCAFALMSKGPDVYPLACYPPSNSLLRTVLWSHFLIFSPSHVKAFPTVSLLKVRSVWKLEGCHSLSLDLPEGKPRCWVTWLHCHHSECRSPLIDPVYLCGL